MGIQIVLDILIGFGGILALIGLGGAISSAALRRRDRFEPQHDAARSIELTVRLGEGPEQTVNVSHDSDVVKELGKVQGIQMSAVQGQSAVEEPARPEDRRTEIVGLLTGVAAGISIALPFLAAGEVLIGAATALVALLLTAAGLVVGRLKSIFTRDQWKATSPKVQAEAIRDAALLRKLPSETPRIP